MYINYEKALEVFKNYVKLQKEELCNTDLEQKEIEKRIEGMDKKVIHSLEVVSDGSKIINQLGFNESVMEFSKLSFLNHDIGRFPQIRQIGNFNDNDLRNILGIQDHGVLGSMVLNDVIKQQIPQTRLLDDPIKTIVNNHVSSINDDLSILSQTILKNEDILNIFKNGSLEVKRSIVSSITQIVQDVDRLDILHQILDDRWTPMKNEMEIDPKVFDMFYKGQYLNMSELKEKGLWNANVGELVRLGFVNQIKLRSVAKLILDENIILRLKDKRQNEKAKDAFDYTQNLLEEMINNSDDGILIRRR